MFHDFFDIVGNLRFVSGDLLFQAVNSGVIVALILFQAIQQLALVLDCHSIERHVHIIVELTETIK